MIWTLILILLALWVVGLIANVTLGGLIHLLLLLALIALVAQLFMGRRPAV